MKAEYYDAIFKRKSFHLFRGVGDDKLMPEELDEIQAAYAGFEKLYPEIRTAIRIVPAGKVNFKHDAEYCVLIYSEKKENYLMNAGYIGEQLDLWLVAHNVGSLWFGIGKPDEPTFDGLDYVIMFAIRKIGDESKFRGDMFAAKRKPLDEIWSGDGLGVANVARFAPSACNSQPWKVDCWDGQLTVFRVKPNKLGIMTPAAASYFNRIDIGIFLCILEICMQKNGIGFERALFPDGGVRELVKVAAYRIDAKNENMNKE
ncbi:MAG: nitroreductase [Ruminococcus sp.]|nr:nitroreductase [Candidatus Apopatosoma intestinale]